MTFSPSAWASSRAVSGEMKWTWVSAVIQPSRRRSAPRSSGMTSSVWPGSIWSFARSGSYSNPLDASTKTSPTGSSARNVPST